MVLHCTSIISSIGAMKAHIVPLSSDSQHLEIDVDDLFNNVLLLEFLLEFKLLDFFCIGLIVLKQLFSYLTIQSA